MKCLIVGLGNPGKEYDSTRHNLGFMVLDAFARKHGLSFKKQSKFLGELAHGTAGEAKMHLLKPTTYMNASGQAVRKCADFYGIGIDEIIIITDDIHLPFGKIRVRKKGSAGGHNGLKDVERHLNSQQYARLRVGVGDRFEGDLIGHVLSKFTSEEADKLPEMMEVATKQIEKWIGETE